METLTKCINPWLQQRQEILIDLHNLAGLLPKDMAKRNVSLANFFQLLIDYVCAGHLQIFNLLLKQNSLNLSITKEILQEINNTTSCIIKYNYRFNKFKNLSANDIVGLLEQFAHRLELEDLLLHPRSELTNLHKKCIN